jgi:L-iditol 2-dehydrogenase
VRAVRLHGVRDMRVEEVPDPVPSEGEVLLAVKAVGVCGSDMHHYLEGAIGGIGSPEPFVLGHEFAAEVVAGGRLPPGSLVAVDPNRACGTCEWCRAGHTNLCPNVQFAGVPPYPGALAEYVTARPEELVPLPEGFDAATAALLEPLGVAIHALDLARLRPMASVAVLGAGSIGLLMLQVARWSGAGSVIVVDPLAYRRRLASELGADATAASADGVRAWTEGRGVDVVLEATTSPEGPQHAAEAVRIGGRLVLVGIPTGDTFTLDAALVRRKGLTIKMSRRMGNVYRRAIALVETGRVRFEPILTHRFELERTAEAFELHARYDDGVVKSVVYPGGVGQQPEWRSGTGG